MNKKQPISVTIAPRTIFLTFFLVLFCFLLLKLSDILLLIFFSLLFAAGLHPTVTWLMRKFKLKKGYAIAILYVTIIGVIAIIISLIVPSVSQQIQSLAHNLPNYQHSIVDYLHNTPTLQNFVATSFDKLNQNSGGIFSTVASATVGVLISIFGVLTVMILTAYFISGGRDMIDRLLSYLPEKQWRARGIAIAERITNKLGYWLRGQLILSGIIFVTHFIGLSLLGIPYALVLSLLAGLLESIPTFGAWFSGIVTVLVALAISPGKAIAAGVLVTLIQLVEANIITPQVMKRALGIPAVMVIISLLVFGKLFGLIGVLFAAPVAAIVAILAAEFSPDGKRWLKEANTGYKGE